MSPRAARIRLAALVVTVGALFAVVALSGSLSADRVRDAVDPLGVAAPIVFVAVSALLSCALVPGWMLSGASGLLFGTVAGTPLSILSAVLGGCIAFTISRRAAGDAVDVLGGPWALSVKAWIEERGFVAVLYARISPVPPYMASSYAAGLTRIPLGVFALASAIGVAPRAFAYTALGGSLDDLGSPEAIAAFGLLAALALAGALLLRRDLTLAPK